MKQYFSEKEFMMGGKVPVYNKMHPTILIFINTARHFIGKPMYITSSYRDEAYNASVGGAPKSMHITGKAVDISIRNLTGEDVYKLVKLACSMDITWAINWDKQFIHLDCRDVPTTFKY